MPFGPAMSRAPALRSIRARIVAGISLILVLLAGITGLVWRAGDDLDRALVRDSASQVTESRINDFQAALSEARLKVVGYLLTEDVPARRALEMAIDRLQAAADAPGRSDAFANVSASIPPVRRALADVDEAITQRESVEARLISASAALINSSTALAVNTSRTTDGALAEAGATIMANVARIGATAARAAHTEEDALFDNTGAAIDYGASVLTQLHQITAKPERVERLANAVGSDLDEIRSALGEVRRTIAWRNERLAALDSAITRAGTAASIAALTASSERRTQRTGIQSAQKVMKGAVTWTAFAATTFGSVVAIGLGLSITRRVQRLSGAVVGLAQGEFGTAVPEIATRDELGRIAGAISLFRERALEQHATLTMRLEAALNNMRQGLLMLDGNGRVSVFNRRLALMFGLEDHAAFAEASPGDLVEAILLQGVLPREVAEPLFLLPDGPEIRAVTICDLPDGRTVTVARQSIENDGWVFTYDDVTERRQAEAKLEHMALHDALTDLPNRTLFQRHLEHELARIGRGKKCAVILLDLDQFKSINDTLGHQTGDCLLQAVAARLAAALRDTDFVARLGGDEFAIIQADVDQPRNASTLAQRVMETIAAPFKVNEHNLVVGVSLGIAFAPTDGQLPDDLLKRADLALYRAKAEGRGTYRFFEPRMDAEMQQRRQLETELQSALINDELTVYYQPLVSLVTGKVVCFEALVRWRHPSRGLVLPGGFITLAEEAGLIVPIGEKVMQQACQDAARWPTEIRLAVNVSVAQFSSEHLTESLLRAAQMGNLDPSRLDIEITESVLMKNTKATHARLERLRRLGMRISMDDFGTGYSSLSYLRNFPIDKLKIDQCFLRDIGNDGSAKSILRAIVQLGGALGIPIVAEGVEHAEQLAWLRAEGCSEVQGFLLGRPCPAEAVLETIERINASSNERFIDEPRYAAE